mmetsp:Transcript_13015/g.35444  ORF Transcript_13015/g.35444 Transcript_13015/m.35444 type:complete len:235 (-) Transcript_13015:480-1184(-)
MYTRCDRRLASMSRTSTSLLSGLTTRSVWPTSLPSSAHVFRLSSTKRCLAGAPSVSELRRLNLANSVWCSNAKSSATGKANAPKCSGLILRRSVMPKLPNSWPSESTTGKPDRRLLVHCAKASMAGVSGLTISNFLPTRPRSETVFEATWPKAGMCDDRNLTMSLWDIMCVTRPWLSKHATRCTVLGFLPGSLLEQEVRGSIKHLSTISSKDPLLACVQWMKSPSLPRCFKSLS